MSSVSVQRVRFNVIRTNLWRSYLDNPPLRHCWVLKHRHFHWSQHVCYQGCIPLRRLTRYETNSDLPRSFGAFQESWPVHPFLPCLNWSQKVHHTRQWANIWRWLQTGIRLQTCFTPSGVRHWSEKTIWPSPLGAERAPCWIFVVKASRKYHTTSISHHKKVSVAFALPFRNYDVTIMIFILFHKLSHFLWPLNRWSSRWFVWWEKYVFGGDKQSQ